MDVHELLLTERDIILARKLTARALRDTQLRSPEVPKNHDRVHGEADHIDGYDTVEDEGVARGQRRRLNFVGAGVAVTDDPAKESTNVTIGGGGGGAPTDADYLVGTAHAGLSAEIVVGTTPGGELGGTWAAPTVDPTHSGSAHHDAVTLAADADVLLGLAGQQLTLDAQIANVILAGPASGGAVDPTFRALVDADIPASIARDSELHAQSHVLATTAGLGAEHTTSGLTVGQVLRASGATTAAFAALALGDISPRDHTTLTALSADDHSIYALLAGRSTGQTLHGGTGASEHLKLRSTAHATKGEIQVDDLSGLVPARMTTAQVDAWKVGATSGGMVYDTDRDVMVYREVMNGVARALSMRTGWYNVRDFGATGDGSTDDQPAIQAAVDAAAAAGGGIVYIPPGTYKLETTFIINKEDVILLGDGYQSSLMVDNAGQDAVRGDTGAKNMAIYRLRFESRAPNGTTGSTAAGAAIRWVANQKCFVSDIWIDSNAMANRWKWGYFVDDPDGSTNPSRTCILQNFLIEAISDNAYAAGIRLRTETGGWGHYISMGTVHSQKHGLVAGGAAYSPAGNYGIWLNGVDGVRVVGVESIAFWHCLETYADNDDGDASRKSVNVFGNAHCRFIGCAFEAEDAAANSRGINLERYCSWFFFSDCTGYGGGLSGVEGLRIDQAEANGISGVYFSNCQFGTESTVASVAITAVKILNTAASTDFGPIGFTNCQFACGQNDTGLELNNNVSNIRLSVCSFGLSPSASVGSVGISALGTSAIALVLAGCDFRFVATPVSWTNTGGLHLLEISGCLPRDFNTDTGWRTFNLIEDFAAGTKTTGDIGSTGWSFFNGTVQYLDSTADHPGILESSVTTDEQVAYVYTQDNATGGVQSIHASMYFEACFIAKASSSVNDHEARIGLFATLADAPADGLYFERLVTDTNWMACSRAAAGTPTRVDTTIVFDTSWKRLEIRRIGSALIEFLIDGLSRASISATLPTTKLGPVFSHKSKGGVTELLQADYCSVRVPLLSRA